MLSLYYEMSVFFWYDFMKCAPLCLTCILKPTLTIAFMIKPIFSLLLFLVCEFCFCATTDIFVDVDTKTKNSNGTLEAPFLSVAEALDFAYELKNNDADRSIVINILPGDYRISKTLQIDSKLNGLSIVGASSDLVSLKGSEILDVKWKKHNKNIYVTKIDKSINVEQLIINDELQILARYPNYNEDGGYWQGYAADAIAPERIKNWSKPEGAMFHAMHGGKWGGFHYQITGVDAEGNAMLEGGLQNNRPSKPHAEFRMVENVFEELDAPGEWFLDKETSKLFYWPTIGLNLKEAQCEVVVLKSLIDIRGTEEAPANDISIEGVKFTHCLRTIFEEYEPLLRSDWTIYRGAALFLEGTNNCTVTDCEFTDLGGNAIFVSGYNSNTQITSNHIHDCGASAISFVGEAKAVRSPSFRYGQYIDVDELDTTWGPKTNDYPRNCVANDNLIHRIGRLEKQTAGVQIAMAMNITVSNNSIYDVPRAGINIGDGTWGGHLLEYNDVFNTVLETGDHGAFNSWGRDRFWHPKRDVMNKICAENPNMPYWDATYTTVIRNNRFRCDHGWDIDLDDGSSNYHIYNNLCLNGGIKLREGFGRTVENNITINNALHTHVWFVNSGDILRRNIIFGSHKDVGCAGWGTEIDYNLFPNEVSLMKCQVYDIDEHSAFGDPQFLYSESLDYTVSNESPALALGFINFPMDEFGVKNPQLKALAKKPDVPVAKQTSQVAGGSPVIEWLRADIKSVDSKEEQSAYGLNDTNGIIVTKIGAHSIVGSSGLKRGDVILSSTDTVFTDVKHFLTYLKANNELATLQVMVMRNQAEEALTLKLK